jgi:hypothetical protein
MAVDRKAEHVGNHGGAYIDNEGMSRQFTYIDHDPKTKVSVIDIDYNKNWEKEYRTELIDRILSSSPVLAAESHQEFIQRGESGIKWIEVMLRDQGTSIWVLRDIAVILENRSEFTGVKY